MTVERGRDIADMRRRLEDDMRTMAAIRSFNESAARETKPMTASDAEALLREIAEQIRRFFDARGGQSR